MTTSNRTSAADAARELNASDALAFLNRDGDLRVPCSRYGSSTFDCSPVALRAAEILSRETGEPMTLDSLDYVMGLVVNNHDDISHLLENYGGES